MNDLSLEFKVIELEQQVREMAKILIMLNPYPREDQVPSPISESSVQEVIDRLHEIATGL